jgi:hypothetical protein
MICYNEIVSYDLEDLGDEAWLTGCPYCGCPDCGADLTDEEKENIEKDLEY